MFDVPIEYIENFIGTPDEVFKSLRNDLEWIRMGSKPRSEYYCNDFGVPYTYGSGRGISTYEVQPWTETLLKIKKSAEELTGSALEVCFLNRYHNQSDHLGPHADDSPEMDNKRPIVIVSLGVEREIIFFPQNDESKITRLLLKNGSACIMKPGMQLTHFHKIPKAGFMCGERISLTFRGFIEV